MALCSVLAPSLGYADSSQAPHFTIRRYLIEGNTKVSSDRLDSAVSPFTGNDRDFSSIQSAVAAIQQAYKEAGYEAIRVSIPKQEVDAGVVRLQVVEAILGQVQIQGNKYFDEANVRNALSSLQEGETPNIDRLGANLRLSNEHYAKQTQVTFRQGSDPKTVDASVNVADDRPWHAAASLDNTGTPQTGDWRMGVAFMHGNVFNRDHALSAQFVTSPDHFDNVKIFGLNYRIPLYSLGDAIEFSGSHSDVNSGVVNTTAGSYGISGSGDNLGGHYIHLLPRFMDWDQRINAGFDYRNYHNNVTLVGGNGDNLAPDTEVHVFSASYSGFIREAEREWGINVGIHQNLPGGDKGDDAAFKAARSNAEASYTLLRYSLNATQNLPQNWQIRAEFSGQHSNDALISGEQFGLGGINSVRGFEERTLANDKGYRGSVELFTPDIGHLIEFAPLKLRALAFYNAGRVWRNQALPGEIRHNHLASVGAGLRGSMGSHLIFRLDVAHLLDDGGVDNLGQKQAQASFVYLY